MFSQEATITAPNGLHVRPATQFVKEAKIFTSVVTVSDGVKTVDGKKLYPFQTLGLSQGNTSRSQQRERMNKKLWSTCASL
ncbi:hypothetical protein BDV30DRAFT_202259 [Aspergillus minisclerotigenes]|uniref:Phosphocarrier protein HPr n=1 Tax=Aspergillus minisclerotigenes TaxID=656917 RepID=A0A5N6JMF5_9EURO|nr:hypothetical protein BDV30DRAFT_202259 [Aspergillus minisclerotigenes]